MQESRAKRKGKMTRTEIISNLDEIVRERKEERKATVKEKQLQDLETIKSWNSPQEGGKDALHVFPELVWLRILQNLSEPDDIRSVRRVCLLFQDLLRGRYLNEVLFPEVLAIKTFRDALGAHPGIEQQPNQDETPEEDPPDQDETEDDARDKELLKLRLVNKAWRDAVQRHLLEVDPWNLPNATLSSEEPSKKVDYYLENFTPEEINSSGNPLFQSLTVELTLVKEESRARLEHLLHMEVERLLLRIGRHLKYFKLYLNFEEGFNFKSNTGISIGLVYRSLNDWMKHMCVVEHVRVFLFGEVFCWDERKGIKMGWFMKLVRENPLPKLKSVKKLLLSFGDVPWGVQPMFRAILKACRFVKDLHVDFDNGLEDLLSLARAIRSLPRVESLEVTTDEIFRRYDNFEKVSPMFNPKWKLKRLRFHVHPWTVTSCEIYGFLERYPSLESVILNISLTSRHSVRDEPCLLRLPNLRRLSIILAPQHDIDDDDDNDDNDSVDGNESRVESGHSKKDEFGHSHQDEEAKGCCCTYLKHEPFVPGIDCVFTLKKLEELTWENYSDPDATAENEIIQFNGGDMDLYSSNLWDLLPALKELNVFAWKGPSVKKSYKRVNRHAVLKK